MILLAQPRKDTPHKEELLTEDIRAVKVGLRCVHSLVIEISLYALGQYGGGQQGY